MLQLLYDASKNLYTSLRCAGAPQRVNISWFDWRVILLSGFGLMKVFTLKTNPVIMSFVVMTPCFYQCQIITLGLFQDGESLHSYEVMQDKLHETQMMWAAVVIPDCVRQADTPTLVLLLLLAYLSWPNVLLITPRFFTLSVTGIGLWEFAPVTCWSN